jgi:hypothetical protein
MIEIIGATLLAITMAFGPPVSNDGKYTPPMCRDGFCACDPIPARVF